MSFIKKVQNFAFANDLWEKNSKIVLAISGGPDSVCMLSIMAYLAPKYNFKLHIAHVNYDLRGKDSEKDELFVKELAKEFGIEISVLKVDKMSNKSNLEEKLRNIRYKFFEELRKKLNFDLIAVAHNKDDQVETALLRIIRGTGLYGLASMRAKNENIIRPLLGSSREEIILYLKEKKLKFRIDKTNRQSDFTRNKVRNKLIPYLEKKFNPSVKENIHNLATLAGHDYKYIDKQAKKIQPKIFSDSEISFKANDFEKYDICLQKAALRNYIRHIKKELTNIENSNIEEIIKIVKSNKSKSQKMTFKGLKIVKNGDIVTMSSSNRLKDK